MISQLCAHYFPIITQVFPQLFPDYHFLLYIIILSWFPPNASHTKLRVLSPRKSSEVGLCDQTLVAGYVAEKTSLHFFEVREGKGSDWRFLRGNSIWHPFKKIGFSCFFVNHIFAGINVLQMVSACFSKQRAILNNFDGECVALDMVWDWKCVTV